MAGRRKPPFEAADLEARLPALREAALHRGVLRSRDRSVAADFRDARVIIMENDDPPADVDASANIITFTGTDQDRAGFIPSSA